MKNLQIFYVVILVAATVGLAVATGFPLGQKAASASSTYNGHTSQQYNTTANGSGEINSSAPSGVMYTTKFECGSIFAGEGPLRPGHYDTDISIFNKEGSAATVLWNAVVNNGPTSDAIMINLGAQNSTGITCQDIRKVLSDYSDNFLEGFVIMNSPFNSVLQSPSGTVISGGSYDTNPLVVQAFYTANALDTLPHEVIVDKIAFYIIQDYTGKIPKSMIRTALDVSVPSTLGKVSNTEDTVKQVLARQFNLTSDELPKVIVRISSINVGVGALIDDHAISLSTVSPQLTP
ncbi:MAG: hypothetical protein KGI33_00360 [Thaumarchaeota archaeon]|nr:hypothetical protein [Nitrososphaerota archaeon]